MKDENQPVYIFLIIACAVCFVSILIYAYNKNYNEKITKIIRYEYVLKFPDRVIKKVQDQVYED